MSPGGDQLGISGQVGLVDFLVSDSWGGEMRVGALCHTSSLQGRLFLPCRCWNSAMALAQTLNVFSLLLQADDFASGQ